jgi:hypothetical protein
MAVKKSPCSNFICSLHTTCAQYDASATSCYIPDLTGNGCSRYKIQPEKSSLVALDIFQQLCKSEGLPTPLREVRLIEDRKYRADYYFQGIKKRVALEVEGGSWIGGRHTRAVGFNKDMEKYNSYTTKGIYLYRVDPKSLLSLKTINDIKSLLQ